MLDVLPEVEGDLLGIAVHGRDRDLAADEVVVDRLRDLHQSREVPVIAFALFERSLADGPLRDRLPVAAVLLLILLNPAWFFLTVSVAYAISGPVLWLRSLVRRRPEGSPRGEPPAAGGGTEEART